MAKMINCINGHQYDMDKFTSCPYCGISLETEKKKEKKRKRKIIFWDKTEKEEKNQAPAPYGAEEDLTQRLSESRESDVTRSYYEGRTPGEGKPVVGWIVCVKGPEKGRDYRLHEAKNRVGCLPQCDVYLPDDPEILRDAHAEIIYDYKSRGFYIARLEGNLYVNEQTVYQTTLLSEGDRIRMGQCEFVFIPFCKEGREW